MSGLDPEKCVILELACVVTDGELNELGEGVDLVIHQPDDVLAKMDDWCTRHHGQSGLTDAVRTSTISLRAAELRTLSPVGNDHLKIGCCGPMKWLRPLCVANPRNIGHGESGWRALSSQLTPSPTHPPTQVQVNEPGELAQDA